MDNYVREIVAKYVGESIKGPVITQQSAVIEFLRQTIKDFDKEHFIAIYLDAANQVITYSIVSIGILNSSQVHAREVFRPGILCACNSVILAHNHPSGDTKPSQADDDVTDKLKAAGKILGIKVLDHIIFTENGGSYSYQESKVGF